jgi:hypothetical protein
MEQEEKDKFEVGKWYKDRDGDFVKFEGFNCNYLEFTSKVRKGNYCNEESEWNVTAFTNGCVPMTIEEMKKHLPESEWWVEKISELFPIY